MTVQTDYLARLDDSFRNPAFLRTEFDFSILATERFEEGWGSRRRFAVLGVGVCVVVVVGVGVFVLTVVLVVQIVGVVALVVVRIVDMRERRSAGAARTAVVRDIVAS
jgi:hypothetical protein